MDIALIAAAIPVTFAAGFIAGLRVGVVRLPRIMAEATPDQLRVLAKRTAEHRRAKT